MLTQIRFTSAIIPVSWNLYSAMFRWSDVYVILLDIRVDIFVGLYTCQCAGRKEFLESTNYCSEIFFAHLLSINYQIN